MQQLRIISGMNAPVSELIELLSLEQLEDNLFRGQSRDIGTKYVFGTLGGAGDLGPTAQRAFTACVFSARRQYRSADRV